MSVPSTVFTLLERVRAKCANRNWYGPDADYNHICRCLQSSSVASYYWYDCTKKEYILHSPADIKLLPVSQRFEYPIVTDAQLLQTEQVLRFPLPPILHALYTQLANGGFGPGYGIDGVLGGYYSDGYGDNMVMRYLHSRRNSTIVDLLDYKQNLAPGQFLEIPDDIWFDRCLAICHHGSGIYTYYDSKSGFVFEYGSIREASHHRYYTLNIVASSLEEWLELWLKQ
jgi:hypothetical protein